MEWLRRKWDCLWFEPAPPQTLGLCRIIFFGALFVFYLPRDFSAWGTVPALFWRPVSLFRWLNLKPISQQHLEMMQLGWKLALALSCIGLFTRLNVAISFVLGVYLLGLPHNFGKLQHADAVLIFAFGILALSHCADSFSLDKILRNRSSTLVPSARRAAASAEYTWPIRTIWLAMALVFFAAGWSKIRQSGLAWITSDQLRILFLQHIYYLSDSDPLTSWGLIVAQYPWLCHVLAGATIVIETGYALALFSRIARRMIVPAAVLMLVAIRVLMGPDFEPLIICHVFWVPWDRLLGRLSPTSKIAVSLAQQV